MVKKYILGVDPSLTCTGLALLDEDQKLIATATLKPKLEGRERLREIALIFKQIVDKYSIKAMSIESQYIPANFPHTNSILKVAEVKGILIGIYYASNPDGKVIDVAPSEAKSCVGVQGRLSRVESKKAVMKMVRLMFPSLEKITTDEADAVAIGLAAFSRIV